MKRKMVYIGLPVLFGLLFASFLSDSYNLFVIPVSAALFLFLKYPAKMRYIEAAVCMAAFAVGFFMYRISGGMIYDKTLEYCGQKVEFKGMITEFTDRSGDMALYTLKGTINGERSAKILYYGRQEECRYGDSLELVCTLDVVENSSAFDYVNYYKSNGIFLRAVSVERADFISTDGYPITRAVFDYREKIRRRIVSVMHYDEGRMLSSMLFGSSYANMDSGTKDAMYRIGTGHVFAVSGFHLMLMASMLGAFLKKLSAGHNAVFTAVMISVLIFVICSGFSVSAVRAGIITAISYSAVIFGRKDDALNSLSIAMIFMTASNPFIVRSPSFMLSVSGFFGIAVFAPYMTKNLPDDTFFRKLFKDFLSLLCVTAVIIPVSSLFFTETSILSAISGIIMMPVISAVLMLGMLVFITGGVGFIAYPLLKIADYLLRIVKINAEYAADFRFVAIPLGYDFMKYFLIVVFAFVCITYALFKSEKTVGISLLLSALAVVSGNLYYRYSSEDIPSITVFGENSSELVIIRKGNNVDIIDISGNRKNPSYAADYMQRYGYYDVNDVFICKNPYRFVSYDEKLRWYNVKSFYLPEDTYFFMDSTVCGCTPEYYSDGCFYIEYNDYKISCEDYEICIEYNDKQTVIK